MELEPILHVWINHDNDLEDLTLVSTTPAKNGKLAQQVYETIHTNKKHPFLTQEYGFLPVSALHVGMHIVRADGTVGEVFAWTLVPGVSVMYNLEVQQDHTFTVGDGQWVVHNCGGNISSELLNKINKEWHPGGSNTSLENFLQHYDKHAEEVGATSYEQYANKAEGFWSGTIQRGEAKKVAKWAVKGKTADVFRYVRGESKRYIDVALDGRFVSFGDRGIIQ